MTEQSRAHDPNMNMCWALGMSFCGDASIPIPEKLVDLTERARFLNEIDGSMVSDFNLPLPDMCSHIGQHIKKVAMECWKWFPSTWTIFNQLGFSLRLWAGCMDAAKTIAYKTAASVNDDGDERQRLISLIEGKSKYDLVYGAGVEAAPAFKRLRKQRVYAEIRPATSLEVAPIPMLLWCPECRARHLDVGEFATRVHHTHACQTCGHVWRPAIVPTVGVQFLPGFKNV